MAVKTKKSKPRIAVKTPQAARSSSGDKNFLLLLLAAVVILGGYVVYTNETTVDSARPTPQPQPKTVTVTLQGENGSKETGKAVLTENNGKTSVVLTVSGEPKGAVQPAHVHAGKCPGVGAVIYPLTNVVNGTSTTTLDVTLTQLKAKLPLAVNIHKSDAASKTYVACGAVAL